jgi:hypothetical protein
MDGGVNRDSVEAAYSCVVLLLCAMAVEMVMETIGYQSIPHVFAVDTFASSAFTAKRASNIV